MSRTKKAGFINEDFGKRLKECRLRLNLSRKELASVLFCLSKKYPESHIYRMECGKSIPTADQLFQIADLFNVDPRWLAYGSSSVRLDFNSVFLRKKDTTDTL